MASNGNGFISEGKAMVDLEEQLEDFRRRQGEDARSQKCEGDTIVVDRAMCEQAEQIVREIVDRAVNLAYDFGKLRLDPGSVLPQISNLASENIILRVKRAAQLPHGTPDTPPSHPDH